jgi:hypothetical protein
MRRPILIASIYGSVLLLMTGCYTTLVVNFGNGTSGKVSVKSAYTQQQIEVAPNQFKKLPHSSGSLTVTSETSGKFTFTNVAPFDIDRKYQRVHQNIFGPNSVTLTVKLETNMELYVVMPGRTAVDPTAPQPEGYPKVGQKMNE